MRRNQLMMVVATLVLLGLVGVLVAFVAIVAEVLSVGWAIVAALAATSLLGAVALVVVVLVGRGPRLVRRFRHDAERTVAASCAAQIKVIDARLSAQGDAVRTAIDAQRVALQQVMDARLGAQEKTLRKTIETRFESQVRRTHLVVDGLYSQLEALDSLYRVLEPERPFPPLRRWAVSPDLALHVVRLVLDGRVQLVVETGSGASTVILAMALEKAGAGRVVSLEHDSKYAEATRKLLSEFGLEHRATVIDAPLADLVLDGEVFRWYDVSLGDLPVDVDLLFVDGPPEATGHQARFPALPVLRPTLAPGALVVLDDGDRKDEEEISQRWASLPGVGAPVTLPVERHALQLLVDAADLEY